MFLRQLALGPAKNFFYLLGCDQTKQCAVIDCGFGHEEMIRTVEEAGYKITKIFLTHFHVDHTAEVDALAAATGAKIYGHERGKLKKTEKNWVIPQDFIGIQGDDLVEIGSITGKALYTPGHQSDHLSFIFADQCFFTGDALFIDSVGRTDLPDSDPAESTKTLAFIKTLPDLWIVYPGHDYGPVPSRSLGEEKEKNPYLQEV